MTPQKKYIYGCASQSPLNEERIPAANPHVLKQTGAKSAFWKQRIGTRNISNLELSSLPALTRNEVREQMD
jgi:hypothetical protein